MATIENVCTFDGSNPAWEISAGRNSHAVTFTLTVDDTNSEATPTERDTVAFAVSQALTAAGFSFAQTRRLDIIYTAVTS
jgi:hypothetical protein